MTIKKVLIIPDCHRPYHDVKAWALLLKIARQWKPNYVVVLGDFADFYAVSSHDKDPTRALQFEAELENVHSGLAELRDLGAEQNIFIAGNHEDRLWRYMVKKAPELHAVLTIPRLLKLKEHGFKYIPYRDYFKLGKTYYTHEVGFAGKHAAAKSMEAMGRNVVIGHCHRLELTVQGTLDGDRHVGFCPGWLGDLEAIEYAARVKVQKDWALGFGMGYYDLSSQYTSLVSIPVLPGYSAIVEGKKVSL